MNNDNHGAISSEQFLGRHNDVSAKMIEVGHRQQQQATNNESSGALESYAESLPRAKMKLVTEELPRVYYDDDDADENDGEEATENDNNNDQKQQNENEPDYQQVLFDDTNQEELINEPSSSEPLAGQIDRRTNFGPERNSNAGLLAGLGDSKRAISDELKRKLRKDSARARDLLELGKRHFGRHRRRKRHKQQAATALRTATSGASTSNDKASVSGDKTAGAALAKTAKTQANFGGQQRQRLSSDKSLQLAIRQDLQSPEFVAMQRALIKQLSGPVSSDGGHLRRPTTVELGWMNDEHARNKPAPVWSGEQDEPSTANGLGARLRQRAVTHPITRPIPIEIIGLDPAVSSSILGRDEPPARQHQQQFFITDHAHQQEASASGQTGADADGSLDNNNNRPADEHDAWNSTASLNPSSVLHVHHYHHTTSAGNGGEPAGDDRGSATAGDDKVEQQRPSDVLMAQRPVRGQAIKLTGNEQQQDESRRPIGQSNSLAAAPKSDQMSSLWPSHTDANRELDGEQQQLNGERNQRASTGELLMMNKQASANNSFRLADVNMAPNMVANWTPNSARVIAPSTVIGINQLAADQPKPATNHDAETESPAPNFLMVSYKPTTASQTSTERQRPALFDDNNKQHHWASLSQLQAGPDEQRRPAASAQMGAAYEQESESKHQYNGLAQQPLLPFWSSSSLAGQQQLNARPGAGAQDALARPLAPAAISTNYSQLPMAALSSGQHNAGHHQIQWPTTTGAPAELLWSNDDERLVANYLAGRQRAPLLPAVANVNGGGGGGQSQLWQLDQQRNSSGTIVDNLELLKRLQLDQQKQNTRDGNSSQQFAIQNSAQMAAPRPNLANQQQRRPNSSGRFELALASDRAHLRSMAKNQTSNKQQQQQQQHFGASGNVEFIPTTTATQHGDIKLGAPAGPPRSAVALGGRPVVMVDETSAGTATSGAGFAPDSVDGLSRLALGFIFIVSLLTFVTIAVSLIYRRRRASSSGQLAAVAASVASSGDHGDGGGPSSSGASRAQARIGANNKKASLSERTRQFMRANFHISQVRATPVPTLPKNCVVESGALARRSIGAAVAVNAGLSDRHHSQAQNQVYVKAKKFESTGAFGAGNSCLSHTIDSDNNGSGDIRTLNTRVQKSQLPKLESPACGRQQADVVYHATRQRGHQCCDTADKHHAATGCYTSRAANKSSSQADPRHTQHIIMRQTNATQL